MVTKLAPFSRPLRRRALRVKTCIDTLLIHGIDSFDLFSIIALLNLSLVRLHGDSPHNAAHLDQLKQTAPSCRYSDKKGSNRDINMITHEARREAIRRRHSVGADHGRCVAHPKTSAHFSEFERLFLWRGDLCDGTQASFGKEAGLVIRQIQQGVKDFWCEFQQVESLGDACSGHAQMFGQVCLGGASALLEEIFENECLFHRINDRHSRFVVGRSRLRICGFNGRYEKLALVQSRKVNPEGHIEKVRKSFGPGEPVYIGCDNFLKRG